MATAIETFSPALINNFDQLKTLFSGEKELAEINQLPKEALIRLKGSYYFGRWQVAWIVMTSPLTLVSYIFLKTVATFFNCLFIRSLSNRLHLMATHLGRNVDYLWTQLLYGSSLLIPSVNDYRLDLSDVFNQNSVKREEILEPRIRNKLHEKLDQVTYSQVGKGLCWGAVHWFNYLLLKQLNNSANDFETRQKCVVGVAKQFEHGQPRQAALMQSIYGLEEDFLDIRWYKKGEIPYERIKDADFILDEYKKLPNGIYNLKLPDHAVSYIKWAEKEFIWDSNGGLIVIERPADLVEFIQKASAGKQKIPVFFALQKLNGGLFNRIRNLFP